MKTVKEVLDEVFELGMESAENSECPIDLIAMCEEAAKITNRLELRGEIEDVYTFKIIRDKEVRDNHNPWSVVKIKHGFYAVDVRLCKTKQEATKIKKEWENEVE